MSDQNWEYCDNWYRVLFDFEGRRKVICSGLWLQVSDCSFREGWIVFVSKGDIFQK